MSGASWHVAQFFHPLNFARKRPLDWFYLMNFAYFMNIPDREDIFHSWDDICFEEYKHGFRVSNLVCMQSYQVFTCISIKQFYILRAVDFFIMRLVRYFYLFVCPYQEKLQFCQLNSIALSFIQLGNVLKSLMTLALHISSAQISK